jgi:uncharacterized membrane protein YbhN (UPF0104 family)
MLEASSTWGVGHPRSRAATKTALKLAAAAGVIMVALNSLSGKLPSFDAIVQAAGEAKLPWLGAAAAAILVSINLFARLQERLLKAHGVAVPHCRMVALTYSRSAITATLPGGSVLSTAYAYREYRRYGADQRTAATVVLLAGVVSAVALAALAASGMALGELVGDRPVSWGPWAPWVAGAVAVVGLGLTALFMTVKSVPARHWLPALGSAVANWLTDLLCLFFALRAFGVSVSVVGVAVLYVVTQLVRQVPLTPGGIGVIEATLLTGLVSLGADPALAAGGVLAYRLLSFGLVVPAGLTGWLLTRTRTSHGPSSSAVPTGSPLRASDSAIGA